MVSNGEERGDKKDRKSQAPNHLEGTRRPFTSARVILPSKGSWTLRDGKIPKRERRKGCITTTCWEYLKSSSKRNNAIGTKKTKTRKKPQTQKQRDSGIPGEKTFVKIPTRTGGKVLRTCRKKKGNRGGEVFMKARNDNP